MSENKIQAQIKEGKLLLAIPINAKPVPSVSGKTLVVATTHGNQKTAIQVNGKDLVVGVNAYIYN